MSGSTMYFNAIAVARNLGKSTASHMGYQPAIVALGCHILMHLRAAMLDVRSYATNGSKFGKGSM